MKRKQTPKVSGTKKARALPDLNNKVDPERKDTKLEQHILNFSKLSQKRSQSDIFANALSLSFLHNDEKDENGDKNIQESIEYFSSFLEEKSDDVSSITKTHVASLIFPWVINSLIQKQDNASLTTWTAFTICLEILLCGNYNPISNDNETLDTTLQNILEESSAGKLLKSRVDTSAKEIVSGVLSQGTMNKLVSCFLRVTFAPSHDGPEHKVVRMAGKCFGLIVTSEFYRPTVDYVCNTIIPMIDELVADKNDLNPNQAAIIYLSVQLVIVLQRKGRATNPKKTFQLVSTPKTLSYLAKFTHLQVSGAHDFSIASVVKDLIGFALFDEFHMDDFRSMNLEIPIFEKGVQRKGSVERKGKKALKDLKKKGNSQVHASYQQALFSSLVGLLGEPSNCKAVALFIPLLVEGFICQSLETDKNSAKKKSRIDLTAKIQFRFWSTLVFPMLEIVKQDKVVDPTRLALIQSLQQCSELLLKYDVYLPSFEDPKNEHLNYLVAIGEVILESAEKHVKDVAFYAGTLRRLFSLNHHIYHDNISRLIVCTSRQTETAEDDESKDIVCIICSTYQKLRQLGHFVKSILTCANDSQAFELGAQQGTKTFVHDISFVRALTSAIQNSPIGQTEEVWGMIDQYIVDGVKENNPATMVTNSVDIFVILLKALRVGPFSSKPIKELCERTMSTSVAALIGIDVDIDPGLASPFNLSCSLNSSGLYLWGWIVHVHNKCCFWLNEMPHEKEAEAEEDSNMCGRALVPRLMASINYALGSDAMGGKSLEALQLLACHRLQQLHSSIFQKQQLEDLTDSGHEDNRKSKEMIEDASLLVDFMISSANTRSGGWKIVCENLSNWIPYAKEDHVHSFLRWFFFTISAHGDSAMYPTGAVCVPGMDGEISSTTFAEEVASATALLHDASFYETPIVFDNITCVGYNCVSLLLFPDSAQSPLSTGSDLEQILMNRTVERPDLVLTNAIGATNILKVLALILSTCDSLEGITSLFANVLRVHVFAAQVFDCGEKHTLEEYANGSRLIFYCRKVLSEILNMMDHNCNLLGGKSVEMILTFVFRTNTTIIRCVGGEEDVIVSSSAALVSAMGVHCASSEKINAWVPAIEKMVSHASDSSKDSTMLIKMLRPSMHVFLQVLESASAGTLKSTLKKIVRAVQPLKEYCLGVIHSNFSSNQVGMNLTDSADCMYFMADAISMEHTLCEDGIHHAGTGPIEKVLRNIMDRLSRPEACHDVGILYLFGTLIGKGCLPNTGTIELMLRVQGIVVEQCKATNLCIHPIISASYAKILLEAKAEELAILGNSLLQLIGESDGDDRISLIAANLHCVRVMANVVKGQAEREVLSIFGHKLLTISNDLIHPFGRQSQLSYDRWRNQVITAQGFMTTIIAKNDLISLKGSDVSNILLSINTLLASQIPTEHPRIDNIMYSTSCAIIISLLKHYPKQLYGCASSLTSALRCLLNHIMHIRNGEGMEMFEEFRKVCELLPEHKDIFKKHVMHLVLFYVDGMQKIMDTSTKAQLEPSIFFLLDTLSEYETKQMNTLMRPAAKPLFQNVYRNYQKHQYKGQY